MSDAKLPVILPQSLTEFECWVREVHAHSHIAGFFFGDMHLWARDGANNSALVLRALERIESVVASETEDAGAVLAQDPVWITIGDTFDSIKAHRRSEADSAVEEMLERYARRKCLAVVTGNHDFKVIAHPHAVVRAQQMRPKKKRGIQRDLSWLAELMLPDIALLAIANDQIHLGPASVTTGFVTADVYEGLGTPSKYADLLVVHIGDKLFLVRHGDLYDTWYHWHPATADIPKYLKHYLAHLGSEVYEGVGWLRKQLKRRGMNVKGAEDRVKEWFNAELRTVCLDIALGLSDEALKMQAIHPLPIGGTIAGHTHVALFGEYEGYSHCNPGHSRSEVGVGIITCDGTLHQPFVIADDRA